MEIQEVLVLRRKFSVRRQVKRFVAAKGKKGIVFCTSIRCCRATEFARFVGMRISESLYRMRKVLLMMAFGGIFPGIVAAQIRDTVEVQGIKFLFAETTDEVDGIESQVINLVRLGQNGAKWLLKHTLHSESPDCNSLEVELGTYAVTDSSIVFYSVWMYSENALAGVCGVRKQVFHVAPNGRVNPGPSLFWVSVGPQHPCLQGLESSQEAMFETVPSEKEHEDGLLFRECIETEFQGDMLLGVAKDRLVSEVSEALRKPIAKIFKKYGGLVKFVKCF
jgi:hypothetical protein